jgi:hypothetical protein
MMDQLDRSWNARLKAEAAGRRVVLQRLIEGCKASDFESFVLALSEVDSLFIHRAAFLKLARMNPPSAKFCRFFRDRVWLRFGDHLRQEVGDDLLFCDVLRVLMPPYRGPALRLYRGETVWNRRQRTYGMSWTTSSEVADSFATGIMRTSRAAAS